MGKKRKSINVAFLWAVVMPYQTLLAEPLIGESVGMTTNRLDTCHMKSEGLNSGSLLGEAGFTYSITVNVNMVSFYELGKDKDDVLAVTKDSSAGDKAFALAYLNAALVLPEGLGRSDKIP